MHPLKNGTKEKGKQLSYWITRSGSLCGGDGSLCGGDGSLCGDLGECRDILRMLLVYVESGRIPLLPYSGNFQGRKLSRIGEKYDFHGENFRRLFAFATPKNTMPQSFTKGHKTAKFVKVSPSKVSSLCMVLYEKQLLPCELSIIYCQ